MRHPPPPDCALPPVGDAVGIGDKEGEMVIDGDIDGTGVDVGVTAEAFGFAEATLEYPAFFPPITPRIKLYSISAERSFTVADESSPDICTPV